MNTENNPADDKRRLADRRQRPTPFWSRFTWRGRRREARRAEEQANYYVDRLHPTMRKFLWGILALAVLDGLATLYEVYFVGIEEANPLMASILNMSATWFLIIKYGVTVIALLVLLLHQFFRYVHLLLWGLLLVYLALGFYHAVLLATHWF